MKHSYKLSDAIHILTYVDIYKNDDLSSARIAASIEANASVVRNLMSKLKKAGLLNNQPGVARASLAKPASEISVLDVYRAIGGVSIFRALLDQVDLLEKTEIKANFKTDTVMPAINYDDFELVSREEHHHDEKNKYDYTFLIYHRKNK